MTTMEPTATEVRATNGESRPSASTTQADNGAGQRELHPAEPQPQTTRQSPDPMQGTDRYRLVTPFTLRL